MARPFAMLLMVNKKKRAVYIFNKNERAKR